MQKKNDDLCVYFYADGLASSGYTFGVGGRLRALAVRCSVKYTTI